MENNSFTIINEDGVKITYDILFTFDSDETNKSYIAYTDNTYDDEGNVSVYASIYNPLDSEIKLEEIKTEKEWKVIETILNTIQQEVRSAGNIDESEHE